MLVNNATASAAELLAAALTDNSRAVLVGTPTFGRGVIHSVKGLNDGSALIFASGYLVRRSGAELEGNGIQPDLMVKGDISSDDAGVPRDRQYRVAVKNLKSLIANNPPARVARNMVP